MVIQPCRSEIATRKSDRNGIEMKLQWEVFLRYIREMKIQLIRIAKKSTYTIGRLYIDGKYFCDTLEDVDRGLNSSMSLEQIRKNKVAGKTAIPTGSYKVSYNYSPKFKRNLPMIEGVPGFVGIQILNSSQVVTKNYIHGDELPDNTPKDITFTENGYLRIGVRISSGYEYSVMKLASVRSIIESLALANHKSIKKNVNWVGMSIWWYDGRELASGFVGEEIDKGYQTLLKEQFDFLSDTGVSYCYSGYSLGGQYADDPSCIMNKASGWAASNDAIWTLDTITNDFKRNIPIGTINDYTNNTGNLTYYGALRQFKDKVAELSGNGAIVICANALRRNNSGYTSTSANTNGDTLTDFEHALMDIAARNHWYFVDQFRLTGVTDDSINLTTLDGLHLNNFGYSLAVKPWIEQFEIIRRSLV